MDDEMTLNEITYHTNHLRKIYSVFICQHLIAIAFMTMATFHDSTRLYIQSHPHLSIIASIITLGILIVFASSENLHCKNSINFFFLFMVTLVLSFLLATTVSRYYPGQVILALSSASLICIALTIFALQIQINLTMMGRFLMTALIALLVPCIFSLFFPRIIIITIACVEAIIYFLYIIYVIKIVVEEYFISPGLYTYVTFTGYIEVMNALVDALPNLLTVVFDDEHFVV